MRVVFSAIDAAIAFPPSGPRTLEETLSYRGEGERQIRTTIIRTVKKEKKQREKRTYRCESGVFSDRCSDSLSALWA